MMTDNHPPIMSSISFHFFFAPPPAPPPPPPPPPSLPPLMLRCGCENISTSPLSNSITALTQTRWHVKWTITKAKATIQLRSISHSDSCRSTSCCSISRTDRLDLDTSLVTSRWLLTRGPIKAVSWPKRDPILLGWKLIPVVFYHWLTLRNTTWLSFQPNSHCCADLRHKLAQSGQ